MPRPLRTDAPGAVHHVMIRGVERRTIFAGDADREDFLARFAFLVRELGFRVPAWCLIPNHAHFVLETGRVPLAVLMARLNSRHAQRFNRNNSRVGHLFQDRYKAVLVARDDSLLRCVAYVLGNPVRHGLIPLSSLGEFRWSGFAALIGRRLPRSFESPRLTARALNVADEHVVRSVRQEALLAGVPSAAMEPDQIDELRRLIRHSCARHGVDPRALRGATAAAREARREICALAAATLDLPASEIASRIGISYVTARRIRARAITS